VSLGGYAEAHYFPPTMQQGRCSSKENKKTHAENMPLYGASEYDPSN